MPTTYSRCCSPRRNSPASSRRPRDVRGLSGRRRRRICPDDDAYKIAKVLYEEQDKLAAIAKTFGRYDKAELAREHGMPFHPGAIKYYREKGIWPAKS